MLFLLQERARVNLEQARQQLEYAQRREAEQLRVIRMLERENRKWKEKQRSIGHDIMANDDCMANINSIARCGSRPPSAVPPNQSTVLTPVLFSFICFIVIALLPLIGHVSAICIAVPSVQLMNGCTVYCSSTGSCQ